MMSTSEALAALELAVFRIREHIGLGYEKPVEEALKVLTAALKREAPTGKGDTKKRWGADEKEIFENDQAWQVSFDVDDYSIRLSTSALASEGMAESYSPKVARALAEALLEAAAIVEW
jgi:hypothetical protein